MKEKHPWLVLIGVQLRHLRVKKGFSQDELADIIGIDRTYIGGIERGERNVSSINLIRIAQTLDVEVGSLFPRVGDFTPLKKSSTIPKNTHIVGRRDRNVEHSS